jgi:hypothetical protein
LSALVSDLYDEREFLETTWRRIDNKDCQHATDVKAQLRVVRHLINRYEDNR